MVTTRQYSEQLSRSAKGGDREGMKHITIDIASVDQFTLPTKGMLLKVSLRIDAAKLTSYLLPYNACRDKSIGWSLRLPNVKCFLGCSLCGSHQQNLSTQCSSSFASGVYNFG
eukprot:2305981-Pleurochrysis_carterae.AAC.1